jgi:glycosyltransferase involved in cell wall biosynthesis
MVSRILDSRDPVGSFTQRWAEVLAEKVDYLYFICLEAYDVTVGAENFEYHSLGKERGYGKIRLLFNYYRLLFRLMGKVDGFFGHMNSLYSILAVPVARIFGVRVISWVAHMNINHTVRLNSYLSDVMVTASEESLRVNPRKKRVLGHGVDVAKFSRDKKIKRRKRIVTIGRVTPVKDNETLIRAVSRIADLLREKGWKIEMIGSSPTPESKEYREKLIGSMDDLEISDLVDFLPEVSNDEVPGILNGSSIFVNMQSEGGAGKAVLESMATETITLLCTDTFNDHLGGKLTGALIYRPRDPEDLAGKLKNLIDLIESDKSGAAGMGRDLRDIVVKHHNLDTLMDRILSLY